MLSNKKNSPKAMPDLNSFYNSFKDIASGEEQGERSIQQLTIYFY